jgi:hypothetical protein
MLAGILALSAAGVKIAIGKRYQETHHVRFGESAEVNGVF